MEYKVSVVVPMYKCAKYIKAAVDGLLDQTLKELEVIVVDDCSPDDSLEICRKLYRDNERVQILTQDENGGPGLARNTGIKAARGEYIAFADSDDGVLKNAYEEMYNLAKEKNDADVVHGVGMILSMDESDPDDIYTVDEKDYFPITTDRYDIAREVKVLSDDMNERYEKWKQHGYHWLLGAKLFRTEFLRENDIYFGDIRLSEDMTFCFAALFLAKTYVLNPKKYYLYRVTNESTSRSGYTTQFFKRACYAVFNVCQIARNFMSKVDYFKENPDKAQGVIDYMILALEEDFVAPIYQELGEDTILSDGVFSGLMQEQFGENADYMTHCFLEMLRKYPPMQSTMRQLNVETLRGYKAQIEQAVKEGKITGNEF